MPAERNPKMANTEKMPNIKLLEKGQPPRLSKNTAITQQSFKTIVE
jgi:hypothetical protein